MDHRRGCRSLFRRVVFERQEAMGEAGNTTEKCLANAGELRGRRTTSRTAPLANTNQLGLRALAHAGNAAREAFWVGATSRGVLNEIDFNAGLGQVVLVVGFA
jgi:hypothetical protein